MNRFLSFAFVTLILASCTEVQKPTDLNPNNSNDLGSLVIPADFNWSSSIKGVLTINVVPDTAIFEVNGRDIYLMNAQDEILNRAVVSNGLAEFYFNRPQVGGSVFAYLPSTGDRMEITRPGNVTMNVRSNLFNVDYATALASINNGSGKKSSLKAKSTRADLIVNGDFETNDFTNVPNNFNLALGKWYVHSSGKYKWSTKNGSKVFESNNNSKGYAYQLVTVSGGDLYTTTANTSGDFCIFIFYYSGSGSYLGYHGYAPGSNDNIDENGTIPSGADYALIKIHGDKDEWIDNVTFNTAPPIQDADGDGVDDNTDEYPNDASRAYTSYFPTSGYQTVAFEDLWPEKGDYDFNDMVLTNNVVYTLDANNDLVDATFTIELDAVGSGFANGLAIVFVDDNANFIAQDIIQSVSGDVIEDPNVTNGLIVFDHVYNAQSEYYQNNGVGPSKTPDVFTFTVTFNSNASNQNIVPDVYIFRSNDRGLEIHLDGFSGTSAANSSYYNTGDDVNGTYETASGLPWVLEVVTPDKSFEHPIEKVDILVAYPEFQVWAESGGSQNQNWMSSAVTSQIFDLF